VVRHNNSVKGQRDFGITFSENACALIVKAKLNPNDGQEMTIFCTSENFSAI